MPDVVKQAPTAADWWVLGAVGLLILVAVFLALAETSLTRMSRTRAQQLDARERPRGAQLAWVLQRYADALNLVLLLVVVVHTLSVALLQSVMARWFGGGVGVGVTVVLMTVVTFVVAEVAPKTYAVQRPDRAALAVAPGVALLVRIPLLGPLTRLLIRLGNAVTPGRGLKAGPFAPSEDEIMATIDEATAGGAIEQEERELLQSVFEFGDRVLREVMVPRTDMIAVDIGRSLEDVLQLILRTGYSRIPVYDGDPDNVVGLVYAKDVLRLLNEGRAERPLSGILRQPPYMPESMRASGALREMRRRASHMAIVIDEYGGTAGLVTIEDLLEEIVGDIADEYDREEPNIEPLPDGGWRVNARLAIEEVNELLGASLPHTEWDTIGGLLFNVVGEVPSEGQEVEFQGLRLRAERVQGRRVGRVRIHRLAGAEEQEEPTREPSAADRTNDGPNEGPADRAEDPTADRAGVRRADRVEDPAEDPTADPTAAGGRAGDRAADRAADGAEDRAEGRAEGRADARPRGARR